MTTIRAVIHDRRIDVPAPRGLPDGTEVLLTIGTSGPDDDGLMSPEEIAPGTDAAATHWRAPS